MSQTSPPLRQRLREVAADAMLAAAERCMLRNGYEQTTMQQIAAEAGCAAGTLYLYFKSKEEILLTIANRRVRAIHEKVREAYAIEADPLRRVKVGFQVFLRSANEDRAFFTMMMNAVPLRHRHFRQVFEPETVQQHDTTHEIELKALKEAQAQGRIRTDMPAELLQEFMEAVGVNLLEHLMATEPGMSADEQVETLWKFISGGIGVKETQV